MKPPRSSGLLVLLLVMGAGLVVPSPSASQQGDGFLFRRPWVNLGFSFGYALPTASSDLFDFTREHLTISRSDFGSPAVQGQVAVRATEVLDIGVSFGWARSTIESEDRGYIGTDGLPILQTTRFSRAPLTLDVKRYLIPRGRRLSRFAWVPSAWSPYVGAGVGGVRYEFQQEGEFVDYRTLEIFEDHYLSNGWARTAHLLAGAEVTVSPLAVFTAEARYGWGSTRLSRDFVDFDDIDLSGFQATAGFALRF